LIAFLRSSQRNFCIQQFIDGPEYTCGLLFDKERVLKDWICARRLLADGRTIQARIVQDPALDYFIQTFAAKFPFEGPLNLQLRMDADGHPRTFEVNPRLSGSTSMRVAVGFNDPERVLEHWLFDTSIVRAQCNCATVYRYLTQLVVPE
jgi:carbamoylphosphate synthase large subunit